MRAPCKCDEDLCVDILEQDIANLGHGLLNRLLRDRTTGKNIIWATDEYEKYGKRYGAGCEIKPSLIIGKNTTLIQPRVKKSKSEQQNRTRNKAEVFTPSWLCNEMNNHLDSEWFGRDNVFNTTKGHNWTTNPDKIVFDNPKKSWQKYIDLKCLEITCGEGPYLVSRYDTTTGEYLPVEQRIGILDRKLRIVDENTDNESDWLKWAIRAYQSTYGYEYQGDSLLLARENLLWTFMDYYECKFGHVAPYKYLTKIAEIIAWNIWQMNGLTDCTPCGLAPDVGNQLSLFECEMPPECDTIKPCRIKNWRNKTIHFFKDLKGDAKMKFDFCIGNPPYQEIKEDTSDKPIYDKFMTAAYEVGNVTELITPARFLFNAGKTPKDWNEKMLNNEHFKVLRYFPDATKVFPNTDIKGGVSIHYYDKKKKFTPTKTFTSFAELNSILNKVRNTNPQYIDNWVYSESSYRYTKDLIRENPFVADRLKKSSQSFIASNAFDVLPELFKSTKSKDDIEIVGRFNNQRASRYIDKKYIDGPDNFTKYKIFLPKANGSGALGEVLSTPLIGQPLIGQPLIGHTQTFISIGLFETTEEASACLKYIKSKFARTMLGVLKITQDNKKNVWKFVPLQDFTNKSDIDWSKSIPEIDLQLYKKYGLDDTEIDFIETHVKEMQ